MYRGVFTSRNNYDDISERGGSRRGEGSSKILVVTILLSIIVCILAVLIWVSVLKTQEVSGTKAAPSPKFAEEPQQSQPEVVQQETKAEVEIIPPEEQVIQNPEVNLSIEQVLAKIKPESQGEGSRPAEDFLSSSDYSSSKGTNPDSVIGESLGINKRAQDLSLSKKADDSSSCVKYTQHIVQSGETVNSIAQMYGITDSTIASVNQLRNMLSITIGSELTIPDRDGSLYVVKEGDTIASIIKQFSLTITTGTIMEVNALKDEEIQVGQKLFIPYDTKQSSGTISEAVEVSFMKPCGGSIVGMFNTKQVDPLSNDAIQLNGILIQSSAGEPVVASADGTVVDRGFNQNGSGYVKIMHQSGYATYYNYLSDVCVEASNKLNAGDVIGYFADNTTNLPNPTIFFRIEQAGLAMDPSLFF